MRCHCCILEFLLLSVSVGRWESEMNGGKDAHIAVNTLPDPPSHLYIHTTCPLLEDDADLRLLASRILSPGQFNRY